MSTAIVTKFELQNQPMTPSISLNDITNKITPEQKIQEISQEWLCDGATESVTQELDARVEKYNQEQKKYNWLVLTPVVLLDFIFIVQFWIQGFDGWVFHPRIWPGTFGISNA